MGPNKNLISDAEFISQSNLFGSHLSASCSFFVSGIFWSMVYNIKCNEKDRSQGYSFSTLIYLITNKYWIILMDVQYECTFDLLIHINLTDIIYICKGSLLIVKYVMMYLYVTCLLLIYIYITKFVQSVRY